MQVTAAHIAAVIEEQAPLIYQESYDNAGFCVGRPDTVVDAVLLCVDVTEAVLEEAVRTGANMVVSHHPVIFNGLKKITGATYVERMVAQAIKDNIVLYAAHTNMDSALHGVSWIMARQLGLQDITILSLRESSEQSGFGAVGNLSGDMDGCQFFDLLKKVFAVPCVRHSALLSGKVRRVAVCGGSGAFLLHDALAAGAQCFVSADLKYHDFFNADGQIIMVDIGHYESEKYVLSIFYELLTKKIPNFAVQITKTGLNPVYYY
ncbi:MAG: Nif3-like dinuclear metal center hexameric protein [Prevotellaceae bacterium]|jgi:dinuclear metal center YbgI/SA1388 family protein|nr:Nif3-like dinuclear metal center hexameric protein [Prevotellaceae bacterium]